MAKYVGLHFIQPNLHGLETGSFLGIKTVAGFIEDAETLAKLGEMGVDCVQGYLIGEPVALESLT